MKKYIIEFFQYVSVFLIILLVAFAIYKVANGLS